MTLQLPTPRMRQRYGAGDGDHRACTGLTMEPADQAENAGSWWASRPRRHLAVGLGWLALATVMLVAALLHRSGLRYALFGAWAAVGIGFIVDAARHRGDHEAGGPGFGVTPDP